MADELQASHSGLEVQLIPSQGGIFEVKLDGQLIFTKHDKDRFPNPGEISSLIK